jgi:DNA-binding response OmpR family regulator
MAKSIAIVEDDPDQRANYVDAITKKGYKVVAYSSRLEAFAGFDR